MELSQDLLDNRQRQQAIDDFLASLSSWDLIYLRHRIPHHQSRIQLATLQDLPPEIIIYLSQFLDVTSLLVCICVCRSWRAAWTCGPVTASLCCRYFPGLAEKHNVPRSEAWQLFAQSSKRYIYKYLRSRSRSNSSYFTRWFLGTNDLLGAEDMKDDITNPSDCLNFGLGRLQACYQDGILAWQPDETYVIINDLGRQLRRRCGFGSSLVAGRRLNLQQVTRELLIFASVDLSVGTQTCRELKIWNIALGEWRQFSLPGRLAKCYADNRCVVALTTTGDAFYWSWDGSMTIDLQVTPSLLMTSPPQSCAYCLQKVPGVVFHPTKANTFFLCWVYKPVPVDHRIHVIVVVKYHRIEPVERYETTVQNPHPTREAAGNSYQEGILRFSLRCQKMNSHGLYMLGAVETCFHSYKNKSSMAKSEWELVCFNVFTETFTHRRYEKCLFSPKFHRPTWDWAEWHKIQAWDDYLVVLWQPRPHVIHEPCTFTELLLATDNLACLSSEIARFGDAIRSLRLEPATTIDWFHQRLPIVAMHVFMDDDFFIYAAPDALLVTVLREGSAAALPRPTEGGAHAVAALDVEPRHVELPEPPLQVWDCEVETRLGLPQM